MKFEELLEAYSLCEGPVQPADIAKSLHTLCKYNRGLWKSEAQAKFLTRAIVGLLKPGSFAERWAKTLPEYDSRKHYPFHATARLEFGRINQSKIRYASWLFLVDPYGVVLRVKGRVQHPTATKELEFLPSGTVDFRRPEGAGPVAFDLDADNLARAKETERRAKENEPVIAQIQAIPGWERNDMLSDFVLQLQQGRTLTARQMQQVVRLTPPAKLEKPDNVSQVLADFFRAVDGVVSAWVAAYKKANLEKNNPTDMVAAWNTFKRQGKVESKDLWVFEDIWAALQGAHEPRNLYRELPKGAPIASAADFIFIDLWHSIDSLQKKRRPTKKSLAWAATLPLLTKIANKASFSFIWKKFFS